MAGRRLVQIVFGFILSVAAIPALFLAQKNGQPASDALGQEDLLGNPTFVGGVTNGGPAGHSIW
ncbi:MAG: hypothetical protein HY646_14895 [Acidobacteria bacterium]|nr:hypothetical protein [Acidobacteriota bacterium]